MGKGTVRVTGFNFITVGNPECSVKLIFHSSTLIMNYKEARDGVPAYFLSAFNEQYTCISSSYEKQ